MPEGHATGGPRRQILVTRLAVMITALLAVVLAIASRLSAAHAHAAIHAASAARCTFSHGDRRSTRDASNPARAVPADGGHPSGTSPDNHLARASTATTVAPAVGHIDDRCTGDHGGDRADGGHASSRHP